MNVLGTLHCWELYMVKEYGEMWVRYKKRRGYKNELVKKIDFDNWIIETVVGYYKLGEHK